MESLDQITGYLDFDLQCQISGKEYAADELTALMCRREVRAIMEWVGHKFFDDLRIQDAILLQLKEQYDVKIIWQAIEQVKNEMS